MPYTLDPPLYTISGLLCLYRACGNLYELPAILWIVGLSCFLSKRESLKLSWLFGPYEKVYSLVVGEQRLMRKFEHFIPWWLENRDL